MGRSFLTHLNQTQNMRKGKKDVMKQKDRKPCVYCYVYNHNSSGCEKAKEIQEVMKTLREKKLCFNYPVSKRRIRERKHHTSICHKNSQMMVTQSYMIHPVFVVKVNNIICRALLDTSARSYYGSTEFLNSNQNLSRRKKKYRYDYVLNNQLIRNYHGERSELSDKFIITSAVIQR